MMVRTAKHPAWPCVSSLDTAMPVNWQHPQALGLFAYWPTLLGTGDKIRGFGVCGDAIGYSDASLKTDPQMGIATGDFVGTTDSDRRFVSPMKWDGGPITIAWWNYAPNRPSGNTQAFCLYTEGDSTGYFLSCNAPYVDDTIGWYYGSGFSYVATADYASHYGKWTHIAVDSDATDDGLMRIYINGVLKGSATSTSNVPTGSKSFVIGANWYSSVWKSHWGRLADLRVYNRVLSAGENWNLYAPQTRWSLLRTRTTRRYIFPTTSPSSTIHQRRLAQILRIGSRSAIAC